MSKSSGSGWESPGRRGSRTLEGSPRVIVPWLSHGAVASIGGCWLWSGSYERVVRVSESRSGTGEMGR